MNEGLGELRCRRHFLVPGSLRYIYQRAVHVFLYLLQQFTEQDDG